MSFLIFLLSFFLTFIPIKQSEVNIPQRDVKNKEDANTRIVGGTEADINTMPYLVSLRFKNKHVCGAAIISELQVLTAAHCLKNRPTKYLTIRAGSSLRSRGGVMLQVAHAIKHPLFRDSQVDYDIAILTLEKPIAFNMGIQAIHLPWNSPPDWEPGQLALAAGWGYLNEDGKGGLPQHLRATEVKMLDINLCKKIFGDRITERMLCGGDLGGGRDACAGDSGGPLVIDGVLVGIVSFGDGCAKADTPGVYTNVEIFKDFVNYYTNSGNSKGKGRYYADNPVGDQWNSGRSGYTGDAGYPGDSAYPAEDSGQPAGNTVESSGYFGYPEYSGYAGYSGYPGDSVYPEDYGQTRNTEFSPEYQEYRGYSVFVRDLNEKARVLPVIQTFQTLLQRYCEGEDPGTSNIGPGIIPL